MTGKNSRVVFLNLETKMLYAGLSNDILILSSRYGSSGVQQFFRNRSTSGSRSKLDNPEVPRNYPPDRVGKLKFKA